MTSFDVSNLPEIRDRAPADGTRSLAAAIRRSPIISQSDCQPDEDGLLLLARAAESPGPVKSLFAQDLGLDGELHYFDGGVLGGYKQIITPPIRILTLFGLMVSNVRDEESSDYSGTGDELGAVPFSPAVQSAKDSSVLQVCSDGPRALDRPAERQRWTIRQVTSSSPNRTIRTVTTEGQRRPIEGALLRIVDNQGNSLAHGITPIDGHGRAGMKFEALVRFAAALGLPFELYGFTMLEKAEQERVIDTLIPCLRHAREQLLSAKTSDDVLDIEVSYRGVRTVQVRADRALAAVHSWTTTAQVVIGARYTGPGPRDYAASLTRRYETVHSDPEELREGAKVSRLAEHALGRLAEAGVFDQVPVYGATIVTYMKMPSDRPDGMELEYLALMAVWAFSRASTAAKNVYADLDMDGIGPSTRAGKRRGSVVAHLVHRALPTAKPGYHTAAAQSLLVGSSALPPAPVWRPISEVMDGITANANTPIGKQALAEARIRTLIAATAAGALQGAYGAQEATRARGQASTFVNRMVTDKSTAIHAWGRRQCEAIVETYWTFDGKQELPQVSQDLPAPGTRYEPKRSATGQIAPVTDEWLRDQWKLKKNQTQLLENSDYELKISDAVTDSQTAINNYTKYLGEGGKVSQAWKPVISAQAMMMVGSLANLKEE
ncbi:hypothetical protein ACWGNM_17300 [Streptomyces sp. NPDC055796]